MAYKHIGVAISGNEEDALLVNKAPPLIASILTARSVRVM